MQTLQAISIDQVKEMVESIYSQGNVVVKEAYSAYGQAIRQFHKPPELLDDLKSI